MGMKSADSLQAIVKWKNPKIIIAPCHLTGHINAAFGTVFSLDGKGFTIVGPHVRFDSFPLSVDNRPWFSSDGLVAS
jgi:hypothetical protein